MQKIKSHAEIKKNNPIKNTNVAYKEKLFVTDKIALWITTKVGTFSFFVFTICLTIIPFIIPSTMQIIMFISSSFLQLVLLPLIMIGQNLQSVHAELRSESTYNIAKKSEEEISNIHAHLENQEEILKKILEK